MFRPRLKTTSGCLTCRTRKKKCDETKPICDACYRLGISCDWRGPYKKVSALSKFPTQSKGTNIPVVSSIQGNEHTIETLKVSYVEAYPRGVIRPAISSGYPWLGNQYETGSVLAGVEQLRRYPSLVAKSYDGDLFELARILLSEQWLQEIFYALGSLKVQAVGSHDRHALHLYSSGVRHLRIKLENAELIRLEMKPILIAVNWLGIIEQAVFRDVDNSMRHYFASLELLNRSRATLAPIASSSESSILHSCIECAVLSISVKVIFCKDISRLPKSLPRTLLESFFPTNPKEWVISSSSYLGGQRDLYYLIYEVSILGRLHAGSHTSISYHKRVSNVARKLRNVLDFKSNVYASLPSSWLRTSLGNQADVLVIALRIFLSKIRYQHLRSTSLSIKRLLYQGLARLHEFEATFLENVNVCFSLRWPLLIYLCAASELGEIAFIQSQLQQSIDRYPVSSDIDVIRVVAKINSIRTSAAAAKSTRGSDVQEASEHNPESFRGDTMHDTLDLLIHPSGFS